MPIGIVPDEALAAELRRILDNEDTQFAAWSLRLFSNDLTPTKDTVFADLVEPTWAGYGPRTLTPAGWGAAVIVAHFATSSHGTAAVQWTNNSGAPVTVFGLMYLDPTTGTLRFVQRFDAAEIVPVDPGGTIALLPKFTYRSE